jgi:putative sulfotransferase
MSPVVQAAASTAAVPASIMDRAVILNTGRCGSTLLSELIAQEPETASISESMDIAAGGTDTVLSGARFWSMVSGRSRQLRALVRMGLLTSEFRYPANGRWAGNLDGLPAMLAVTLPSVSPEPDRLFDQLATLVPQFPTQLASAHQVMLLDLLATLTGRRRWVERSGGSCTASGAILHTMSAAKVVYLTRNVADTARSMSRHPAFQFVALRLQFKARCGIDPYSNAVDEETIARQVPSDLRGQLPEGITAEVFWAKGRSSRWFEGLCATMHERAEQALAGWDPDRLHRLRYEDLVTDPRGELVRLGRFLDFADPAGWADQVAHRVRRKNA